jgi:ribonuclease HII
MVKAARMSAGTEIETDLRRQGFTCIAGTDEVGRGPLAGPVVACAVVLPAECHLAGVTDSKLLSDAQRRRLAPLIMKEAVAYGMGVVDAAEIDRINILQAAFVAMRLALGHITTDAVIVDGAHRIPGLSVHQVAQPKADSASLSVACASILAKVTRDDMMLEFDGMYPGYGFASHKGYAAARHFEALDELGPCAIHRGTFLVKWRERNRQMAMDLSTDPT